MTKCGIEVGKKYGRRTVIAIKDGVVTFRVAGIFSFVPMRCSLEDFEIWVCRTDGEAEADK